MIFSRILVQCTIKMWKNLGCYESDSTTEVVSETDENKRTEFGGEASERLLSLYCHYKGVVWDFISILRNESALFDSISNVNSNEYFLFNITITYKLIIYLNYLDDSSACKVKKYFCSIHQAPRKLFTRSVNDLILSYWISPVHLYESKHSLWVNM